MQDNKSIEPVESSPEPTSNHSYEEIASPIAHDLNREPSFLNMKHFSDSFSDQGVPANVEPEQVLNTNSDHNPELKLK